MVLWDAPYPTLYQQSDVTLVSEPLLDGTDNKQNRSRMTVNRCSLILTLSLSTFAANLPILTHTRSGEIEISRNVSTAPAKMVPTQRLYHRLLAGWERNRAMYFPPLHFRNTIPRTTTFSEAVFLFVNLTKNSYYRCRMRSLSSEDKVTGISRKPLLISFRPGGTPNSVPGSQLPVKAVCVHFYHTATAHC